MTVIELFREGIAQSTAFAGENLLRTYVMLVVLGVVAAIGLKSMTGGDWSNFVFGVVGVVCFGFGALTIVAAYLYGLASHPDWNEYVVVSVYGFIPLLVAGGAYYIGWKFSPFD